MKLLPIFFHLIEHACRNLVKFDCLESLYINCLRSCIPTTIIVRSIIHPILPTPPLQGELCLKGTLKSISTLWFKHDKSGIAKVQLYVYMLISGDCWNIALISIRCRIQVYFHFSYSIFSLYFPRFYHSGTIMVTKDQIPLAE